MIRETVLDRQDKIRPGWQQFRGSSRSATTFISEDWVVQRRPAGYWQNWTRSQEIISGIDDQENLLLGAQGEGEVEDGWTWLQFKRYDLPGSPATLDLYKVRTEENWQLFSDALPDVLATIDLLADQPWRQEFLSLPRSHGAGVKLLDWNFIRDLARKTGLPQQIPLPAPLPPILSHGDTLLKNVIRTEEGYRLIDWENFGAGRRGDDIFHMLIWTLYQTPVSRRQEFISQHEEELAAWLGISKREYRLQLFWAGMREALFWKSPETPGRFYKDSLWMLEH